MSRRKLLVSILSLTTSMLASRARGAPSVVLAARYPASRGRGRRRAFAADGAVSLHSNLDAARGLNYRRGGAFFGTLSAVDTASGCSPSIIFRRPAFISPPIMHHLRGGGSNINTFARNNSTSADDGNEQRSWRRAYLAVGSNLGDKYRNIAAALAALEAAHPNAIRVVRTSYLRMTAPMYVTDQPSFLNGAVEVETTLPPLELLRAIKGVESDLGRDVGPESTAQRYGPRPVDLDILLFDGYEVANSDGTAADTLGENKPTPCSLVMQTEKLEIPHPRMAEREFVLSPMMDLEGAGDGITHPVANKTITELLDSLLRQKNSTSEEEQAVRVLPLPRGRMLSFNRTLIIGILNITPDSFSDGGKYSASVETALSQARQLVEDGADIIDVGGESTRPGAEEVAVKEELERVLPVITRIREDLDVPISIDTRHSAVAKAAVETGADIVNDVSGGTHDPKMLSCVASLGVPLIIMHMRGNPKTMQSLTNYTDENGAGGGVVSAVAREMMQRSAAAEAAGIPRWLQVLDPGIGFAKDLEGNLALLAGADELRRSCDNLPFLFGPSRKGFIGKIAGEDNPEERDFGTIAACLAAIESSSGSDACNMLRVHNVKAMKQAVLVSDAIKVRNGDELRFDNEIL